MSSSAYAAADTVVADRHARTEDILSAAGPWLGTGGVRYDSLDTAADIMMDSTNVVSKAINALHEAAGEIRRIESYRAAGAECPGRHDGDAKILDGVKGARRHIAELRAGLDRAEGLIDRAEMLAQASGPPAAGSRRLLTDPPISGKGGESA